MTAQMEPSIVALEEEATVLDEMQETNPENIPLPTDSMVTVRLSDANLQAEPATFQASAQELNRAIAEQNSRTSVATSSLSRTSSRSSSGSSQASSTSNSVDWEGLERTEEQEVKDDATDEVRRLAMTCSRIWLT